MNEPNEATNKDTAEGTREEQFEVPDVDIYETDEGLVLLADMPGVGEGDVEVSMDEQDLTILGRVRRDPHAEAAVILSEYGPRNFRRVFTVSKDLDTSRIEGRISQGVLRLVLPKSDRAKVRRIPIQGG